MILIGDAGGSSTSWRRIDEAGSISQFKTIGLNISVSQPGSYLDSIFEELRPFQDVSSIHFYVAGFRGEENTRIEIRDAFAKYFTKAEIFIESDLLGAARSLHGSNEGWVGILGTGANMAFYDGSAVNQLIPSLGYVLGDEGSGAHIGKKILVDFCRKKLPSNLQAAFDEAFGLSIDDVIGQTYRSERPNLFLASFTKFIAENLSHPYCYDLVLNSFEEHINVFLRDYDQKAIAYTGSIAFHFAQILRKVGQEKGINIGKVSESPIAGLTLFHQEKK